MDVRIKNTITEGSCNYCEKGKLSSGGIGLIYPYNQVVVKGKSISTRFCKECFEKLANMKISELL